MRWNENDLLQYENAKEFIDTAMIPVFAFNPNEIGVEVVKEQKWMEEVCVYAERQLTGRAMLFPTFYRFEVEVDFGGLTLSAFKHVLFITTNLQLAERLKLQQKVVYILERKEDEEELAVMMHEGKKLAQRIMDEWKTS